MPLHIRRRPFNAGIWAILGAILGAILFGTLPISAAAADKPAMVITDPVALDILATSGLAFGRQLGVVGDDAKTLYRSSLYESFVQIVTGDLEAQERFIKQYAPRFPGKIERFRSDWLRSPNLRYRLAAVVNRFDRRGLLDTPCGEIRLIYRPVYQTGLTKEAVFERLPMTVMLVFSAADGMQGRGCAAIGKEMLLRRAGSPQEIASRYLHVNKLGVSMAQATLPLVRLEFNLQSSRWPTTADAGFSDQSHYLMRVLVPNAAYTQLIAAPLENTPDVERLVQNPDERAALRAWLLKPSTKRAATIGSLQLPTRFLTTKATSVSPNGLARLANRPFSTLFADDATFSAAQLRRLDTLSCVGCHQSRSIAGFHVLGFDAKSPTGDFTLHSPFSAYFDAVQSWRQLDLHAAINGSASPVFPSTERGGNGTTGDSCGTDQRFASWTCQSGFYCDSRHSDETAEGLGQCLPKRSSQVGMPCDTAMIITKPLPIHDKYAGSRLDACGKDAVCAPARAGFPNGFCTTRCQYDGDDICTAVPTLGPFSACLDRTHQFRACAHKYNVQVGMPRCKASSDCRRGYACINTSTQEGYCAPPYFLPELTLEPHQL